MDKYVYNCSARKLQKMVRARDAEYYTKTNTHQVHFIAQLAFICHVVHIAQRN